MPNTLVRSWFSHKPILGRDKAGGSPLISEVPVRKRGRSLGGKPSPTKKGVFYVCSGVGWEVYVSKLNVHVICGAYTLSSYLSIPNLKCFT
jgi:hypothetical protein